MITISPAKWPLGLTIKLPTVSLRRVRLRKVHSPAVEPCKADLGAPRDALELVVEATGLGPADWFLRPQAHTPNQQKWETSGYLLGDQLWCRLWVFAFSLGMSPVGLFG